MSITYTIFSHRSARELDAVVDQCEALLSAWLELHEGTADRIGDFYVGGAVPAPEQAKEMVFEGDEIAQPGSVRLERVLEQLSKVRSAITIDGPGAFEVDRLQLSVFRVLAKGAGEGLVDLYGRLEPTDALLTELQGLPGADDFPPEPVEAAVEPAAEPPKVEIPPTHAGRVLLAMIELVGRWQAEEKIELEEGVSTEKFAERMFEFLGRTGGRKGLLNWLLNRRDVAEVYASEEELLEDLRKGT